MPRSCGRSSTFRSESGTRTYTIAASRMISEDVLNKRKGLCLDIFKRYETALFGSNQLLPTEPITWPCAMRRPVLAPGNLTKAIAPAKETKLITARTWKILSWSVSLKTFKTTTFDNNIPATKKRPNRLCRGVAFGIRMMPAPSPSEPIIKMKCAKSKSSH